MDDFSVAERERDSSGSFSFLFGSLAFSFCFSVSNEPKSSGESIQEREREREDELDIFDLFDPAQADFLLGRCDVTTRRFIHNFSFFLSFSLMVEHLPNLKFNFFSVLEGKYKELTRSVGAGQA